MAKAILVMDMPESCSRCPLEISMRCSTCEMPTEQNTKEKPSWCPFKLMPEKTIPFPVDDEEQKQFSKGWNACIDAICGKE